MFVSFSFISPWNDPISLTRAWCLFELYCTATTDSKFEVAMSRQHQTLFFEAIDNGVKNEVDKMLATINTEKSF